MKSKRKKVFMAAGISLGALLILAAAGFAFFSINVGKQVAFGLLYQNQETDTKENSRKQLAQWNYDLEGFEEKYQPELISVTAADGVSSPGAVFLSGSSQTGKNKKEGGKAGAGKNTAILIHGLGGDHVAMAPVAEIYLENGWNVISIDQRASGDSPDDKVSFGYFEKQDVAAWADYAGEELKSERIVLHGQSMGAATAALYAATEHAGKRIEAVILDSCFDSMESMFLGVWREMEGTEGIPEDYIVACGDWYLRNHYGFGFGDADVCEKLKENNIKTLMIQSERDEIVPNEKAEEMFQNIVAKDKKICYFDSEHVEGVIDAPREYEEAVFTFLK